MESTMEWFKDRQNRLMFLGGTLVGAALGRVVIFLIAIGALIYLFYLYKESKR